MRDFCTHAERDLLTARNDTKSPIKGCLFFSFGKNWEKVDLRLTTSTESKQTSFTFPRPSTSQKELRGDTRLKIKFPRRPTTVTQWGPIRISFFSPAFCMPKPLNASQPRGTQEGAAYSCLQMKNDRKFSLERKKAEIIFGFASLIQFLVFFPIKEARIDLRAKKTILRKKILLFFLCGHFWKKEKTRGESFLTLSGNWERKGKEEGGPERKRSEIGEGGKIKWPHHNRQRKRNGSVGRSHNGFFHSSPPFPSPHFPHLKKRRKKNNSLVSRGS